MSGVRDVTRGSDVRDIGDAPEAANRAGDYDAGTHADGYQAARAGAVVAERRDRKFVRVHGRDPVKMVQGLISNDIANAPADRVVYATVLTPKGRMVADLRVVRVGADLLLETDSAAAEGLAAHLRKFVPPLFAKFEDASDTWSALGIYGPGACGILKAVFGVDAGDLGEDGLLEVVVGQEEASTDAPGDRVLIVGTAYFGVAGYDLWVRAARADEIRRALADAGATPAGAATLDVLRIEAGSPRWGAELTDSTIPLEAGLRERAISETKGCYTGQEVIIRILHRGHVNWHLRQLTLGDVTVPAAETPLFHAETGKQVGRVTSAARSPRDGQTIALGYVRREVEPGSALVRLGAVDGTPVKVVA